jgi:hypothetical protein
MAGNKNVGSRRMGGGKPASSKNYQRVSVISGIDIGAYSKMGAWLVGGELARLFSDNGAAAAWLAAAWR